MYEQAGVRFMQQRRARRGFLVLLGSAGAAGLLAACSTNSRSNDQTAAAASGTSGGGSNESVSRPAGWTDASHGKAAEPDYGTVFPDDRVNTMTISVTPETWAAMLANMTTLFGTRGSASSPAADGGVRGGNQGGAAQGGGFGGGADGRPPAGGGPGGGNAANPDWAKATVAFNGKTWTTVGFRFKGNSSLMGSWRNGTDKLPIKLDFDQWEDEHEEIKDQRFFGFKQLSLSNNFGDITGMRETVAYDLLEKAGLVAANTAAYEILLDHGDGPASLGLYTVIEVIDNTVISRAFKDDSGNIYEAEGQAASFAAGTQSQIPAAFEVEGGTNADWSDITALYNAIHAQTRTTDPVAWRKGLEAVFDVDTFLKWLGLATTIQHWDTYGSMTHNYYLYNDPATKHLTWISWDHNFILGASAGGGGGMAGDRIPAGAAPNRGGGGPGNQSSSFDKQEVTDQWPLIRYILNQPEYYRRYTGYLKDITASVFKADELTARYQALATILQPHSENASAYQDAVNTLATNTTVRRQALDAFLATVS